jgi:hypothetical protein
MQQIRSERPALRRNVVALLRSSYRRRRRLPVGPLTNLVGPRTCADVVMWGELEHRFGIAGLIGRLIKVRDSLAAWRRRQARK